MKLENIFATTCLILNCSEFVFYYSFGLKKEQLLENSSCLEKVLSFVKEV